MTLMCHRCHHALSNANYPTNPHTVRGTTERFLIRFNLRFGRQRQRRLVSDSLLMHLLQQTLHARNLGQEVFWILFCNGFINLQRLVQFLPCLLRLLLVAIEHAQFVERLRYVRQIGFRIFLGQLAANLLYLWPRA
jgi:hypothetical protein